jgi:hypothetical protein
LVAILGVAQAESFLAGIRNLLIVRVKNGGSQPEKNLNASIRFVRSDGITHTVTTALWLFRKNHFLAARATVDLQINEMQLFVLLVRPIADDRVWTYDANVQPVGVLDEGGWKATVSLRSDAIQRQWVTQFIVLPDNSVQFGSPARRFRWEVPVPQPQPVNPPIEGWWRGLDGKEKAKRPKNRGGAPLGRQAEIVRRKWTALGCPQPTGKTCDSIAKEVFPRECTRPGSTRQRRARERVRQVIRRAMDRAT